MKYVLVLEKDLKLQQDILNVLDKIDPKLQVRFFSDLAGFASWTALMTKEGPLALSNAGSTRKRANAVEGEPDRAAANADDQLVLVISSDEIMGSKNIQLIRKFQIMCMQKNVCSREDPTAFVLTAFDSPDFDIKSAEDRVINNLVFKPFDELILRQMLIFAISGRHPPSEYAIHNMKTATHIEMIKDVEIEAYSELGFVTRSQRDILPGMVAKYYGQMFKHGNQNGVFARSYKSEPHPEFKGDFQVSFSYFGLKQEQLTELRKNVVKLAKQPHAYDWNRAGISTDCNIVMIDEDESTGKGFSESLVKNFAGLHVFKMKSYGEFLFAIDPSYRIKNIKKTAGLPQATGFKIIFDAAHKVKATEPDLTEKDTVFGMNKAKLLQVLLKDYLPEEQVQNFLSFLEGKVPPTRDLIFNFRAAETEFFVRADAHNSTFGADGKKITEIVFSELSEIERNDWINNHSFLPPVVHAVFASSSFVEEDLTRWQECLVKLKERVKDPNLKEQFIPRLFVLAKSKYADNDFRRLGTVFSDIIHKPVDRNSIIKKINFYYPYLPIQEKIEPLTVAKQDVIQVGNPVPVEEISEAGVVMNYYRPISIGSFRKFRLDLQGNPEQPILHSTCNFCEEVDGDEKTYKHQFVFFGIRDLELKKVRMWTRDAYILTKGGKT